MDKGGPGELPWRLEGKSEPRTCSFGVSDMNSENDGDGGAPLTTCALCPHGILGSSQNVVCITGATSQPLAIRATCAKGGERAGRMQDGRSGTAVRRPGLQDSLGLGRLTSSVSM